MRASLVRLAALSAILAPLALSACKSTPELVTGSGAPAAEAPPPEPAAEPPAAAPAVCVPPGSLAQARLDGDGVFLCTNAAEADAQGDFSRCFHLDLASGALAARPVPRVAEPADAQDMPQVIDGDGWRYDRGAEAVSLCTAPGECTKRKLDLGKLTPAELAPVATSGSGKLIAVSATDKAGAMWVLVFDRASGKRVAKKKVSFDSSYVCGGASFAGETLVVGLDVCAGPGGVAWLARPTTLARIADLGGGGADFNAYDPAGVPLGGDLWAFRSSGLGAVVVQDVVTGEVLRRVDLSPLFPLITDFPPPYREIPAYGGLFGKLPSGELVAVADEGGLGHVAVLDPAATRVTRWLTFPLCAGAP